MSEIETAARERQAPRFCILARALRFYVLSEGIDHKGLAPIWQCSESTVSRFLNGHAIPDGQTMGRIIAWTMNLEGNEL